VQVIDHIGMPMHAGVMVQQVRMAGGQVVVFVRHGI
jgi:hypothetical protein